QPPSPTDIYTLSLHDALPISSHRRTRGRILHVGRRVPAGTGSRRAVGAKCDGVRGSACAEVEGSRRTRDADGDTLAERRIRELQDRKSTRLNSSHDQISYAVF